MPENPVWTEFRRQMPVAKRWAYFDHAAVSPLPKPAQAAITAWARQAAEEGDTAWPAWAKRIEQIRATAARMIGAEPEEIALTRSTTEGVNIVAEGYPWQPGDNIVTLADEFPTNLYPWMNLADRGVEARRVPTDRGRVDLDQLAAACDARTRIVSVSWVGFFSGWRNDVQAIAEIAHRHGALFFLDAIQGLGVFPLDAKAAGVDFLSADGHKWLLGPEGAGVFFLRREHLDRLRPVGIGWNSMVNANDYGHIEIRLKPTAARYEGGAINVVGLLALGASLDLLIGIGPEALSQRVLQLTDYACRRLTDAGATILSHRDGQHGSGIVSLEFPGRDHQALRMHCLRNDVVLSCRLGRLRIAAHGYNNQLDIDRLVSALEDAQHAAKP